MSSHITKFVASLVSGAARVCRELGHDPFPYDMPTFK